MVACIDHSVFALNWSGRVFASGVESGSFVLNFSWTVRPKSRLMAWQTAMKAESLGIDQTVVANSALSKEKVKFPRSLWFHHFLKISAAYACMKAKSSPVDGAVIFNSSSEVAQVTKTFVPQQRQRSQEVTLSVLQIE